MSAVERAEYMAIVVALAAGGAALTPVKTANDAMYLWIAANRLAKGA